MCVKKMNEKLLNFLEFLHANYDAFSYEETNHVLFIASEKKEELQ